MLDIQNFIGKSSTEADRKRDYRRRIEEEKTGQKEGQMSDKNPPEIEIDKEIEIEIEKDIKIDDDIDYYTSKINSLIKNKTSSSSIEFFINLYGLDDFKILVNEIEKSNYLKQNINFSNLKPEFINKALNGAYRNYHTDDDNYIESEEDYSDDPMMRYGGVPPLEF